MRVHRGRQRAEDRLRVRLSVAGSLVLLGDAGHRARRGGALLDAAALSWPRVGKDLAELVAAVLWGEGW